MALRSYLNLFLEYDSKNGKNDFTRTLPKITVKTTLERRNPSVCPMFLRLDPHFSRGNEGTGLCLFTGGARAIKIQEPYDFPLVK